MMESVTRTHGSRVIQLVVIMSALLSVSAATSRILASRMLVGDPLFLPDLSEYGGKGKSTKGKSKTKGKGTKGSYVPYLTGKPHPAPTGGPWGTTEAPHPVPTGTPGGTGGPAPGQSKKGKNTKGDKKGDKGAPYYTPPPAPTTDHKPASPTPVPDQRPASPTQTPDQKPAAAAATGLDCDAVENGTAPQDGPSVKLQAALDVAMYTAPGTDVKDIINGVYGIMNGYVRYWLLGCPASGRRLQEATMINAIMDPTGVSGTRACETSIKNAVCVALDTPTVAFYMDDGETSTYQARLDAAINKAIDKGLFVFPGVASVNIPGKPGYTDPKSSAQDDNGLNTAGKVSLAVLSLALLLLAALFVRRRRSSQDENFVKQINGNDLLLDDDMTQDLTLGNNNTRVLGDDDTLEDDIFYGIADESATLSSNYLGGSHAGMDVHVCQSSLCEACEQRKNGGISFVKIGAPSALPRIPDDASRDYSLSDTVML